MATAYHFEPVEVQFEERNAEELNRLLHEVRAAFEALLDVPQADLHVPDVGVQADQIVEIEVILENRVEIAAVEDPVAGVVRGRGRGRPREKGRAALSGHTKTSTKAGRK